MSSTLTSYRIQTVGEALTSVVSLLTSPVFNQRLEDPQACDFALGNPHEMPLEGFVAALQRWNVPQNKDWYAYKLNEPEPRQEVVESLRSWRGVEYDPEDIFLTNGAFAAISVALGAVVDPGDEVIFISPPWFFYEAMIVGYGGVPIRVRIDMRTLEPDLDVIAAAISPKTRAIILNSPHNPTGKIYSRDFLQRLAALLMDAQKKTGRPIYLLSDEAYSRIIFDGRTFDSPTRYYPFSLLLYTYGKTLLTPGQRIGFIVLPPEMPEREDLRQAILISQLITGYAFPNALLQHALADLDKLSIDISRLQQRRDLLVDALCRFGYDLNTPEGTFYLLVKSPMKDEMAFYNLLIRHNIYCLPGAAFEMPGFFRLSLTASDEMVARALPGFEKAIGEANQG